MPTTDSVSLGHPVRNVVLVGPRGSGKTTLVEQLLACAGALDRMGSVEEGSTTSDFEEFEIQQKMSVSMSVASATVNGVTINLLDTPGADEFVGEVRAGLRAADAALFVISVTDGVDAATAQLWQECASVELPRAIVVTHLDRRKGDFDDLVAICRRVFDEDIAPIHLPLLADNYAVAGLMDLLTQQIHDYSGQARVIRPSDLEHGPLIQEARNTLIESIIAQSEDESLMDRYLDDGDLGIDQLIGDLELAIARGHFHPVVGSATTPSLFGAQEILDLLCRAFPAPSEHPLPYVTTLDGEPLDVLSGDPNGPLCAEIIKSTSDPYAGRISVVRIFSGSLGHGDSVHVAGHVNADHPSRDAGERIGVLHRINGRSLTPVSSAQAGDIVAVAKLTGAQTADTLSDPTSPMLLEPWLLPEPALAVALMTPSEHGKLGTALTSLVAEDPTLRLELNEQTQEWILRCMGDTHLQLVISRLASRYSLEVQAAPVRVALRETFAAPASGHGRVAKQTGGHGQFASCEITVDPLPPGSGYEFVDAVVGGSIPHAYIPSVDRGLRRALAAGLAAGYPVVDVRVTLTGGKAHDVDSSDLAFQMAAELALRDAAQTVGITLLEPVDTVTILTANEFVGALTNDVLGRRGRVTGTMPEAGGHTTLTALIPQTELGRYAIELRALTHGTATFTRVFCEFASVPPTIAQRIQSQQRT